MTWGYLYIAGICFAIAIIFYLLNSGTKSFSNSIWGKASGKKRSTQTISLMDYINNTPLSNGMYLAITGGVFFLILFFVDSFNLYHLSPWLEYFHDTSSP
jgi:hypothetical protein